MTNNRRASDILEQCISLVFSGQETIDSVLAKYPEYADEIRPELEAALWLRQQRAVSAARPGFVAASSKRLVDQIKQESSNPAPVKIPGFKWDPALLGLALATVFIFVSFFTFRSGIQYVNNSLPGDPGYSLKLTVEEAQLSAASDVAEKAALHIEFADRRAHEISSLVEQGRYEDAEDTFINYRKNLTIAADLIKEMDGDPVHQAELAQDLATTTALNNEMFGSVMAAAVDMPAETALAFNDAITLGNETVSVMIVVLDDLGLEWVPPTGVKIIPTATLYSSPTNTETQEPTNTQRPTSTPTPTRTFTPSPTLTLTATWDPRTPTLTSTPSPTATWDPYRPTYTSTSTPVPIRSDDGGDDEIKPTQKPKPTRKPTKTPKDK